MTGWWAGANFGPIPSLLVLYVTSLQGVTYARASCTAVPSNPDTHHAVQCSMPAGTGTALQIGVQLLTQNSTNVVPTVQAYAPPQLQTVQMPNVSGLSTLGGEPVRRSERVRWGTACAGCARGVGCGAGGGGEPGRGADDSD